MILFGFILAGFTFGMIIAYSTIKNQIMHGTYVYPTTDELNKTYVYLEIIYIGMFMVAIADIIWNV